MIEVCVSLFPSASYFDSQDQLNSAKVTATLQKPYGQLWLYGFDGKAVHIGDAAVASQDAGCVPELCPDTPVPNWHPVSLPDCWQAPPLG